LILLVGATGLPVVILYGGGKRKVLLAALPSFFHSGQSQAGLDCPEQKKSGLRRGLFFLVGATGFEPLSGWLDFIDVSECS